MNTSDALPTNAIAMIALANEYCLLLESAQASTSSELIDALLRLLPRIYISARDLKNTTEAIETEGYIEPRLEEASYDTLRNNIATILGEDDTYLEVFEEDMKYSDTPVAATISENLADIFQELYNFVETVRDATTSTTIEALAALYADFTYFWSQTLCNVLRALNHLQAQEL